MSIDRVTLQILSNHCQAAAEAMARTLLRTAHSTFVKESEDFTCGLVTPEGKTLRFAFRFWSHMVRRPRLRARPEPDRPLR